MNNGLCSLPLVEDPMHLIWKNYIYFSEYKLCFQMPGVLNERFELLKYQVGAGWSYLLILILKYKFVLKPNLSFLPTFQSELRHGPFYYMKQPLTTDPVDVVPQDGRNDFYCWVCHREGQVLCCELCPRVYHAKCLKLTAEPEGDWFCPECEV